MKFYIDDLLSASCDLHDVRESLQRRKGMTCLGEVREFLESLEAGAEIDNPKLQACIAQVEALLGSLDKRTLRQSKDDEDSGFTIKDCLDDVLDFLKSLLA